MSIQTPPETPENPAPRTHPDQGVRQLDHIDEMCHRIVAFIDEFEPVLRRFADPGGSIRAYLDARKGRR